MSPGLKSCIIPSLRAALYRYWVHHGIIIKRKVSKRKTKNLCHALMKRLAYRINMNTFRHEDICSERCSQHGSIVWTRIGRDAMRLLSNVELLVLSPFRPCKIAWWARERQMMHEKYEKYVEVKETMFYCRRVADRIGGAKMAQKTSV